ncbi:MAG: hemerythrin domain-containing protein [Ignavibacteriae bacterium]|nr:hemerythrin domain-containing protein [Ignavibacteriota bacterium]MCB0725192.1 hemerythrin domain-containing protein [Ignavibacteriota bacterium]MCB9242484.1 hemerythrin domain-containing protein [Ignavibacteriales bacterium]
MGKPLKRIDEIKPFSRDHHHSLLLCWKIKTGLKKGIPINRIKAYTDWFYKNHIVHHFELEEKHLYPVLGIDNELIKQAIEEHKQLTKLFTEKNNIDNNLELITTELEKHIRFEEGILFNEIQKAASDDQLMKFEQIHSDERFVDNLSDEFWLYKE